MMGMCLVEMDATIMYSTTQLYTYNTPTSRQLWLQTPAQEECGLQVSYRPRKKRPTRWVRPPSQRGKVERRIGWKKPLKIFNITFKYYLFLFFRMYDVDGNGVIDQVIALYIFSFFAFVIIQLACRDQTMIVT